MSDGLTDTRSQPDPERPVFARRMSELRAARGQSLQFVADHVGLSKTHVWQLENGDSDNPGLTAMTAIARHFGVTVAYLIGESDMTAREDFDALRGNANHDAASAPRKADEHRPADRLPAQMKHRAGFEERHMALDLAVRSFADAADHPDVTKAMLARADAFLAWLEGKSRTAEAVEPERAPGEPEKAPAEMAEVGDVVEIIGLSRAVDGERLVLSKDSRSLDEKLRIKCDGFSAWVHDRHVKRIVHKADEAVL